MKYISFFILQILLYSSCHAQKDSLVLQPYFQAIIVRDIDASIDWYTSQLDYEVINLVNLENRGIKQANLKRGAAALELIELNNALQQEEILAGKPKKTKIAGLFKMGFKVKDLDKWVDRLSKQSNSLKDQVVQDPISGKRMVIIKDPDGNRIQLFEQ